MHKSSPRAASSAWSDPPKPPFCPFHSSLVGCQSIPPTATACERHSDRPSRMLCFGDELIKRLEPRRRQRGKLPRQSLGFETAHDVRLLTDSFSLRRESISG